MVAANFRLLTAQVDWLGLRVGGHQMNRVNSRNDFGCDDSAINIVMAVIIRLITAKDVSGTARCWPFNPHGCFIPFKLCFSCETV